MRFAKPIELHMILVQFLKIKLIGRVLKLSEVRVGAVSHNLDSPLPIPTGVGVLIRSW